MHFECWREILAPFGIRLEWAAYRAEAIGISDREMLATLCRRAHPPVELELVFAEYPRKRNLFRARMLERASFSREVLDLLPKLGDYKLGVVTSSGAGEVRPILEAADVLRRFAAAVYGGDVGRPKPAPDPYLLALERLGVRSALAIEDSDAGERSARSAGLDVLRIERQADMPALLAARLGL